jgi:hypothetical protein
VFFESLPPTLLIPFSADPSLPCRYLGRYIARCEARAEPPSLFIYLLIPAAAANPTAKRDHPFANETRYRHYNQQFVNDDNSTIGGRTPLRTLPNARHTAICRELCGEIEAVP